MNKCFERHTLPKLTQRKIDNVNTFVSIEEIKLIAKGLPKKKFVGPNSCTVEFYQTFKK